MCELDFNKRSDLSRTCSSCLSSLSCSTRKLASHCSREWYVTSVVYCTVMLTTLRKACSSGTWRSVIPVSPVCCNTGRAHYCTYAADCRKWDTPFRNIKFVHFYCVSFQRNMTFRQWYGACCQTSDMSKKYRTLQTYNVCTSKCSFTWWTYCFLQLIKSTSGKLHRALYPWFCLVSRKPGLRCDFQQSLRCLFHVVPVLRWWSVPWDNVCVTLESCFSPSCLCCFWEALHEIMWALESPL